MSILNSQSEFKFVDGYKSDFDDKENQIDIQKVTKLFFSTGPKWIDKLFNFRNKIVSFFGLKTVNKISEREQQLQDFHCELNEQIGLFKVFYKSENEVVLGEDDRHLDFRVSLFLDKEEQNRKKELTISTSVKFNNWFGKLYFIPVKPFHQFIVPAMLKAIIANINQEINTTNSSCKQAKT